MRNFTSINLALVVVFIFSVCFAGNFTVSNITADEMKRDSGNVWVSLKATVTNNGSSPRVAVPIQAVDKNNHTMKNFGLKGTIPPGATGELIGSIPVSEYEFKKITKWIVAQ
ncbi:MAG: hypothetical protein VR65_24855 [Desulfobulbaceae bacterium BRH_c16a]|nr:MAG: hypothetical protein VR65_24855 [Desulfobulbaceae bacterium BRH_c16a]